VPADPRPQVDSSAIGGGWSLARVHADGIPPIDCLKWESKKKAGMSCFIEEAVPTSPTLSTTDIGGNWSAHTLTIAHYRPLRCLKWMSSSAGGVSCLPQEG
jgi:hypothetical protein